MLKVTYRTSLIAMLLASCFAAIQIAHAQLAPGVQQSAAQTATITGTVVKEDGTPVAGADMRLYGVNARLTTVSDAHGTFSFTTVPYGTYSIDAMAANVGTASRTGIVVKGDMTVAIQYITATSGLKEIARVATSSAGAQINVTPASIGSVTPSAYAFQGNTSWRQLLNQIPGVTVSGALSGGQYSGTLAVTSVPDGPLEPIILSINGALPYETATSLDGMPLTNTSLSAPFPGSGTDLAFLPMSMFDTADIVRGPGADAPSIVNSIGGSFVLHAPGPIDGNHVEFSASNDAYGGIFANIKESMRVGRLSATLTYALNNSPGPLGTQGMISAVGYSPSTIGGQAFNGCSPGGPSGCYDFPPDLGNPNYQNCDCAFQSSLLLGNVPVSTAWKQHNGAIALSYLVTPSVTAQIFYAGSSTSAQQPGPAFPVNFTPGSGYAGSVAPGESQNFIYTPGSQPAYQEASSLLEEKVTAYVGRGVLRVAALQNNSWASYLPSDICPANGQYTLYGTGYYASDPNTPVNFNGTPEMLTFGYVAIGSSSRVNNRDLSLSYVTQIGSASSVGISYVTSYYNDIWNENLYLSSLVIPLVKNPTPLSEMTREVRIHAGTEISNKLSVDASWYFARGTYHIQSPSDPSGNTWMDTSYPYSAPRFGAVWRVNPNMAIRAAAGGGYALPGITNLIGTDGAITCYVSACNQTLTNLNLKPEESFGFNVGADVRFHRDTTLSFDLYRVNLYGQFYNAIQTSTYTLGGITYPLIINQYNNFAQSRYEGINLNVRHDVQHGLYWQGEIGLTRGYVVSVPAGFYNGTTGFPPTPCTNCMNTEIIPGINFVGSAYVDAGGGSVPYANGSAQIGYRWSPQKYIDLSPTYYGNNNPYYEPAFLEFDVHAGYALTKGISLLATFRNITGIYGQNYQVYTPTLGSPTVAGAPYPLFGIPYGPRSVIVTLNFKQ